MPITYELVKVVSAQLYASTLRKVPEDTKRALRAALGRETNAVARQTLETMLLSAETAERDQFFVCSDAGIPTYHLGIGTKLRLDGDIKRAIADGFDDLVAASDPPLLPHVNRSSHRHYSSFYSEPTRQLVAERHARDIETFGYTFEPAAGRLTPCGQRLE